ncbi:hypothetical protein NLG97_g634 [Lecanicillium saksenae]|uniref:Uncharacterized protein n=1 Tax=Lecanicillium saksenae TaxID=468837 RepID=A0ACC1R8N4_9HYPO|nr:hypothetical protein NLG97_g634 [Lecanicillium saksenae]
MTTGPGPGGLDIGIVGAGIAGLATAIALLIQDGSKHRVTVFEKYPNCQPAFSGPVQLHTNATRILAKYGVSDQIESCLPEMHHSVQNIHKYRDGRLLYNLPTAVALKLYQSPVWNLSRNELLDIMLARASELGAVCKFNAGVVDVNVDVDKPLIQLESGETLSFDLVIAADGIHSKIRTKILGSVDPVCPLTAYSLNVDRDRLKMDKDLNFLLNRSGFWIGPKKSVVGMDLPSTCSLIYCNEKDDGEEGVWDRTFDVEDIKKEFADAEPRLLKALDLADGPCYIWSLSDIPELSTWISSNGKVVLIGDAAHAMLPFAAQGAGCSLEDSACLAECITRTNTVSDATAAFEAIRKTRTTFISAAGRLNLEFCHLANGPAQEARDAGLEMMWDKQSKREAPPPVPDATHPPQELRDYAPPEQVTNLFTPVAREYVSGYDIFAHTRSYFAAHKQAG